MTKVTFNLKWQDNCQPWGRYKGKWLEEETIRVFKNVGNFFQVQSPRLRTCLDSKGLRNTMEATVVEAEWMWERVIDDEFRGVMIANPCILTSSLQIIAWLALGPVWVKTTFSESKFRNFSVRQENVQMYAQKQERK